MPPSDLAAATDPQRDARARHWRRTRRLVAVLLLAWSAVGFGVTWFARELDFPFFGWPFSFWMAAQGGIVVFVALIAVFAWRMTRHDRRLAEDLRRAEADPARAPR